MTDDVVVLVSWASVVAGVVCIIIGIVYAFIEFGTERTARTAAQRGADSAKDKVARGFGEQADLAPSFEALSKLATALKDLDKSGRFFVLALGFFAVAGVSSGVGAVADAVSS